MRFKLRQKGFVPHVIERTVCGEPLRLWIADTDARDWYERSTYLAGAWPEMEFLRDRMIRPGGRGARLRRPPGADRGPVLALG